ncbi:MAG: site-specific integrase [Planctomycetaceae bacterium]
MSLAAVRDLRVARAPVTADDLIAFETDVLAGFVLARAAAGLADSTIATDVMNLEQVRAWLGRPLWEMEPADADAYFGKVMRESAKGTRLSRAQALKTYFLFLEVRHKVEIHQMTGRVVECPIDQMNRPRGRGQAKIRIPPSAGQVERLFAGWREELARCRKFAPSARNYTACRLMSEVGLRVNEVCKLDLADVKWDLGRFGKLHVRHGKGARGSGPRERMVPLINGAGQTLQWFVEDVWGHFGDDHTRPGVALLPSERKNADATPARIGAETLRVALARAAATHLPDWPEVVTPHVLRHFCASQLYLGGMDLIAIQATLGHAWIATTMNYVHVPGTHIEDAWISGQQRAAARLTGLGLVNTGDLPAGGRPLRSDRKDTL